MDNHGSTSLLGRNSGPYKGMVGLGWAGHVFKWAKEEKLTKKQVGLSWLLWDSLVDRMLTLKGLLCCWLFDGSCLSCKKMMLLDHGRFVSHAQNKSLHHHHLFHVRNVLKNLDFNSVIFSFTT